MNQTDPFLETAGVCVCARARYNANLMSLLQDLLWSWASWVSHGTSGYGSYPLKQYLPKIYLAFILMKFRQLLRTGLFQALR